MTSHSLHLSRGGTSVVLEPHPHGLPVLAYWGPALGDLTTDELSAVVTAQQPQRVSGGIDVPARLTLLPLESAGWQGTPGLIGDRGGAHLYPRFTVASMESRHDGGAVIEARDDGAGLALAVHVGLTASGLLSQRLVLTNTGDDEYEVRSLNAFFPLHPTAAEVLDTTGRHLRERSPQRHELTTGTYARTSRRGRPGADATVLLAAGAKGFGFEHGLVQGIHLAWSGNQQVLAEKTPAGQAFLAAGEVLSPREVVLAPGGSYSTPEAIGSWGDGLNELSGRFHRDLRSRASHPQRPRPVTLNTWEAVYFDLDLPRLQALADRAASLGVERFVLDDGWFRGRRDDTSSLGDWYVDETVWPDGLAPIIDHVRGLGMEFGLWFEPEMVNPDSDLARTHPEWMLRPEGRLPLPGRQQQVLNLGNPDAYAYILERLDDILTANDIAYVKWDHNRDLLEAADALTGHAAVHRHVEALYRLLDELRLRHPGLEIESCASGGARVDLGILARTDRIWTSDCIDPIERLVNQKYTGLVVPPELLGMHVGGPGLPLDRARPYIALPSGNRHLRPLRHRMGHLRSDRQGVPGARALCRAPPVLAPRPAPRRRRARGPRGSRHGPARHRLRGPAAGPVRLHAHGLERELPAGAADLSGPGRRHGVLRAARGPRGGTAGERPIGARLAPVGARRRTAPVVRAGPGAGGPAGPRAAARTVAPHRAPRRAVLGRPSSARAGATPSTARG
ncbi:hypothetical protein MN0502_21770 [Arthrobacter sp. MN05-02]|nr:hypothetical protein MN0502_21770 [Arthrobacter sp. MN05-02]